MSTPSPSPQPSAPAGQIRVLVVDDSAFMRQAISRLLSSDPGIKVVDIARDGLEGLAKAKSLQPDVVTMDIEMPNLDGLAALTRIRQEMQSPPAVVMCSSLTKSGSQATLKALRLGAADFIAKEHSQCAANVDDMGDELIAKVKAVAGCASRVLASTAWKPASQSTGRLSRTHRFAPGDFELVVVGSSTGGPPVLETLIEALPAGFSCPIIIAQHMPALFTKSLAERLHDMAAVRVVHGEDGAPVGPGVVYVAPGGKQTRVRRNGGRLTLEVNDEPGGLLYKPCVNELFSSAARLTGSRTLGIICTGMGDDGLLGSRDLKGRGGTLLAQDMASCVVYGMPRAVNMAGLCDANLPPNDLADLLVSAGAAARRVA